MHAGMTTRTSHVNKLKKKTQKEQQKKFSISREKERERGGGGEADRQRYLGTEKSTRQGSSLCGSNDKDFYRTSQDEMLQGIFVSL